MNSSPRHRLALLVLLLAGCGGNGVVTDAGSDATPADAGPDTGIPHPGTGTYAVTVYDGSNGRREPLAGATVAFDYPGGGRRELVTGSDGLATFDGIDWSAGNAAFVAHAPGRGACAYVDVREGDGGLPCLLAPVMLDLHTASGDLLHPAAAGDLFFVSASSGIRSSSGPSPHYTLPFVTEPRLLVVATEFAVTTTGRDTHVTGRVFAAAEAPDGTADVTLDVDLATPLALATAHGRIVFPAGVSTGIAAGAGAYPQVTTRESNGALVLGAMRDVTYDATANAFDYTIDYAMLPAGRTDEVVTTYPLYVSATGEGTQLTIPGYPVDGAVLDTLLPSPVLSPPGAGVHVPLTFVAPPAGTLLMATFAGDTGATYVVMSVREGTTELVAPALPSTTSDGALLGGSLAVTPAFCTPSPDRTWCDAFSVGTYAPLGG